MDVHVQECEDDTTNLRVSRVDYQLYEELKDYISSKLPPKSLSNLQVPPSPSIEPMTPSPSSESILNTSDSGSSGTWTQWTASLGTADESDLPSFDYHASVILNQSYFMIRCRSVKQRDEIKKILYQVKTERVRPRSWPNPMRQREKINNSMLRPILKPYGNEQRDEQRFGADWYVTECCCEKDVPHRVEDKFILLTTKAVPRPMLFQSKSHDLMGMDADEDPGLELENGGPIPSLHRTIASQTVPLHIPLTTPGISVDF